MRDIIITTAGNINSLNWRQSKLSWEDFCAMIETPRRSPETHAEYMSYPKAKQAELKDVGAFVGGAINGTRRMAEAVEYRDIITLDLDNVSGPTQMNEILDGVEFLMCPAVVYSTRKHTPDRPRLRVCILTSRSVMPGEYEPIARKLAQKLGINYADPTTYDINRGMYWPSVSRDAEYLYRLYEGDPLEPETILSEYGPNDAWRRCDLWPIGASEEKRQEKRSKLQQDPREKTGIIGAWCRVHDVYDVIENVLEGVYIDTTVKDRYTYVNSETYGGAVVYGNGLYMYSHHSHDPAKDQLCNAWDLARIHLYGHLDADVEDKKQTTRLPSYKEMVRYAGEDHAVQLELRRMMDDSLKQDFSADTGNGSGGDAARNSGTGKTTTAGDEPWQVHLVMNRTMDGYKDSQTNFDTIMRYDPALSGICYNEFQSVICVDGELPWSRTAGPSWTDADLAGLAVYLDKAYHIYSPGKMLNALTHVAHERSYNPVAEYLEALPEWDGVPRVDTLLCDYFGAENNSYNRSVMRKTLVAAVARTYEPGRKFDTVLILRGPQGIGKSTFFARLGGNWFSDSLTLSDMQSKTAAEKLQGYWIVEIGELVGMSKTDENLVKAFTSRVNDSYRASYGRYVENHMRRCIIVGTTNADAEFLRDQTGGRRFWPVTVSRGRLDPTELDDTTVGQIWKEALEIYKQGEKLYLTGAEEAIATEIQASVTEVDDRVGVVRQFLNRKIPDGWDDMGLYERRAWLANDFGKNEGTHYRDRVQRLTIWCECFGNDYAKMRRSDSFEVTRIMKALDDEWEQLPRTQFDEDKLYGPGRGWQRVQTVEQAFTAEEEEAFFRVD